MFVTLIVIPLLLLAGRVGANTNSGFQLPGLLPDRVTVVGGIRDDMADGAGDNLVQQHLGLRSIAPLTSRQDQMQQLPTSTHGRVQFGGQSSSAASQATPGVGIFFFSVGLSRPVDETGWAFTLLESR